MVRNESGGAGTGSGELPRGRRRRRQAWAAIRTERAPLPWWRCEDCHYHQTIRSRILDRMHDARWSEGSIAGIQQGSILTDANHAAAFENEIQLVLSVMGVGSVLLTRFEGIQTDEKRLALHDRALAHLVRCKLCKTDDPFCNHDLKCTDNL